jgi:integrase
MYLDWWKSELGVYALADVTKTLIIEKRDKLIATGKNGERRVLPLAHHALELMQAQYEGRNKVSPLVFPSSQEPTRPWESRAAWLAVLENYQSADGDFTIPDALKGYFYSA